MSTGTPVQSSSPGPFILYTRATHYRVGKGMTDAEVEE